MEPAARGRVSAAGGGEAAHLPSLDGVRAVAVYLVVLFHSGVSVAAGGFVGVDVFFVLSGFLITNLLLQDLDRHGRIRFARFYARRARRLLPAAVVVTLATSVAFLLVAGVVERLPFVRDAQSALLYVANWRFLSEQNDYFATGVDKSPFLHFWSLAIEEQFYVVFPLLLFVVMRLGRSRPWVPLATLLALFGLSLSTEAYWAGVNTSHAYYGTDARAYQLLAGCLLAVWLRQRQWKVSKAAASAAATVALPALLVVGSSLIPVGVPARGVLAVAAALLLVGGLAGTDRGAVHRLLSGRLPSYAGRISYGTYLWHWPIILVLAHVVPMPPLAVASTAVVIATLCASASYHLLEMPIRRAQVAPRLQWVQVAVGVTACALVAVIVVPPVLSSSRRPAVTEASAAQPALSAPLRSLALSRRATTHHRLRVPSGLNWSAMANDFGPERTCDASDPQRCIVVHGHGMNVVLVGDSHGRMLAPALMALAREHDFTLSLNVIPSCPWQAQLANLSQPPAAQAHCNQARDVWYRTVLPKLHPDLVVLATYARDDPAVYQNALKRIGGSSETLHELIRNTTNETLARITAAGARALILDDIITADFDPLNCLSGVSYVDQCSVPVPRVPSISDTFYKAAAKHMPHVYTFDVNHIVCPAAPLCSAMLDGINVWRNDNHYSTHILVRLRDSIWRTITASGALAGLI